LGIIIPPWEADEVIYGKMFYCSPLGVVIVTRGKEIFLNIDFEPRKPFIGNRDVTLRNVIMPFRREADIL
jgi:hypothetical protein